MQTTLRVLLLLGWMAAGLGCASRVQTVAREEVPMTTVAGTLLGETFHESRFYRTDGRGHDTWFSTEIELAVEAPAELAGARRRFAMPLGWPVSYAKWKGQRVRLTLPQAELARIAAQPESAAAQLPLAVARLELESEKR